jgi:hypothetical protein
MVDFGPERGLSVFETTDRVHYFEDFKKAKTKRRAKRSHLWMGTNYAALFPKSCSACPFANDSDKYIKMNAYSK